MIATGILTVLWNIAGPLVDKMPVIAINYDGISNSTVFQFLKAGLYLLPTNTVFNILTIVIGLWVFRIVIAFLHSLWAALPVL